jgi:hypothetical protein
LLRFRDNARHLEACGDHRLGQGEVEYVREISSQLVCTYFEDVAGDTVWTGSFASIHTLEGLTDVSRRDLELTVFYSSGSPHGRIGAGAIQP